MLQDFSSNPRFALSKSLRIGVLLGGSSSERKISIRSGRAVSNALRRIGFKTLPLDAKYSNRFKTWRDHIDLAFVALHGRGGEDGQIQKTLEQWKVPYIGSDAPSSLRAFHKGISKKVFAQQKISTPPFLQVHASNWRKQLKHFPVPFVVKPFCEGSSIGVFIVEDLKKEDEKIRRALNLYGELLIEKKIEGREFTVGILGPSALPVVELKTKRSFYDYRAKYTRGMTEYEAPALIADSLKRRLQNLALKVHKSLGLRDFSRVDMMVDEKGNPYVLEANSIPGFTELSLLPKAAQAAGFSFEELCYTLVRLGYERNKQLKQTLKGRSHGKKEA